MMPGSRRGGVARAALLRLASGLALCAASTVCLAAAPSGGANATAAAAVAGERAELRDRVFEAVVDVFKDHYWQVDRLDWDAWSSRYRAPALTAPTRQAFDRTMRRMIEAVGDDHSTWLGLASYAGEEDGDGGELGFGILSRFVSGVGMVIERVLPRSPAERAGLVRGDTLVAVNGGPLAALGRASASQRLEDAIDAGTLIAEVRRARDAFEVRLEPMRLSTKHLMAEPTGRLLPEGTGYLYVPSFTREDTGVLVHDQVRRLEALGARRLVLDLRGNTGGNLNQLGIVLGAFMGPGEWAMAVARQTVAWRATYELEGGEGVSRLTAPNGHVVGQARVHRPVLFDGPLAVVVDADTSSAAEVAAKVLQRGGRARVVGQRTPGNVEAVQGFPLLDGSVVMVAVANLEGADGASFDDGVTPDVVAVVDTRDLARGFDAPVAVAQSLLAPLPFLPGKVF